MPKRAYALKERLDRALLETSSEIERDAVYGLLYHAAVEATRVNLKDFYRKILNNDTLSGDRNDYVPIREDIERGKILAKELEERVIVPEIPQIRKEDRIKRDDKKIGRKIKTMRHQEYFFLLDFVHDLTGRK